MRKVRWTLIIAFCVNLLFSATLYADEVQKLTSKLDEIEMDFLSTEEQFDNLVSRGRAVTLAERLHDGVIMMEGGDYERASFAFLDILEHSDWAQYPDYRKAKFYLSRSLYEAGYYRMAQRYLFELLSTCTASDCQDSMALILQVAQRTQDWDEVNSVLDRLGSSLVASGLGSLYDYMYGRSLFLQGENAEALESLQKVVEDSEWGMKADYLTGVILTQDRKLDEAIDSFEHCASSQAEFPAHDQVRDLALIAIARVNYEKQDWSAALDSYQRVSERSIYFSDVLFELTWTHLRRGEVTSARQSLELLLLSYPSSTYALEGRRLKADIERSLGNYDEAVEGYNGLLVEFEPVMNKMKAEESKKDELVTRVMDSIDKGNFDDVELVPYAARELLARDEASETVESMLNSLTKSADNTATSKQIIEEIEQIMNSEMKFGIFSEYQRYWEKLREFRVLLVNFGAELNEYVAADKSSYSEERRELSMRLNAIPQSQQDIAIRTSLRDAALVKRRGDLYQLKLEADSIEHRVKVVQSWLRGRGAAALSKDEREQIETGLAVVIEKLGLIRSREQDVGTRISSLRMLGGLSESEVKEESSMIARLDSLVKEEWGKIQSSSASTGVAALQKRQQSLQKQLDHFDRKLELAVDQRIARFRERLARESSIVAAENTRYLQSKALIGETAGEIAINYWEEVFHLVHEMVLGADLGIVDVAWLRKDEASRKLNELREESGKEKRIMMQDFNHYLEVMGMQAAIDAAPSESNGSETPNAEVAENAEALEDSQLEDSDEDPMDDDEAGEPNNNDTEVVNETLENGSDT